MSINQRPTFWLVIVAMTFEMFTKMASGFIHRLVNLINGRLQSNFSHSCASSFFGGKISKTTTPSILSISNWESAAHSKAFFSSSLGDIYCSLPTVHRGNRIFSGSVSTLVPSTTQRKRNKKKDPHIVTSLCIPILCWKDEGHILLKVELRYADCRASLIQPLENRREIKWRPYKSMGNIRRRMCARVTHTFPPQNGSLSPPL